MAATTLQDLLDGDLPIIADGGMGTMLFSLGLENGEAPELWNVEQPDRIRRVHRQYIEAGAQIILTNTFGGNRIRLKFHDIEGRAFELNQAAAQLARKEADAADHPVVVAGSMGPSGSILEPYGDLSSDEASAVFKEQAAALIDGGVDVLWIETMSALEEVRAAVAGIRAAAADFPIVATMTFDVNGHTMMGVSPEKALEEVSSLGVLALGGNCGNGPAEIETVITKMHAVNPKVTLVAKSNAGVPQLIDDVPVYDASPEDMGHYAARARDLGATIIGSCCGSTPDHIRAIRESLQSGQKNHA
jgi:5-methyltetrahydrofolate--homocysteine methyltransferase